MNMTTEETHLPVLLQEAIDALNIKPNGIYIDGTFGRGGHSRAILSKLGEKGSLLAFDKDPAAINAATEILQQDMRFSIVRGSFTSMSTEVMKRGWEGEVDGILLDLGVSSPQLDHASRGFSFREDGPLDMRMDPEQGVSAAQWIASAKEKEIAVILKQYGEERYAKRIAAAIVRKREEHPVETTAQLAQIVSEAHPRWERDKHPATRSFQAIRIYINRELDDLDDVLANVIPLLKPQGRLVVISFHSLEDRRVKQFIRDQSQGDEYPPDLPIMNHQLKPKALKSIGKAMRASEHEIEANPRSRSAVMRVAEKAA
jgi:16S rRNA (cytosine1402-N4)-methyltransferase